MANSADPLMGWDAFVQEHSGSYVGTLELGCRSIYKSSSIHLAGGLGIPYIPGVYNFLLKKLYSLRSKTTENRNCLSGELAGWLAKHYCKSQITVCLWEVVCAAGFEGSIRAYNVSQQELAALRTETGILFINNLRLVILVTDLFLW